MTVNRLRWSRRQWLRHAAALAGSARGMRAAPSDRVTLALIGAGWMGLGNLQDFLADPRVQVVAVCDVDRKHAAEGKALVDAAYGNRDCAIYHEFEEVLARPSIEAVCLSVPDHWHGVMAVAAARAGKDIYGEKPIAHNWAEARAVVRAVERYGRVFQTGSWQRSVERFRFAAELVRNGRIGKVHTVEVGLPSGHTDFEGTQHQDQPCPPPPELDYERWLGPAPAAPYCPARVHKNWRYHLDYGGGLLMDWIGHHLDIAHWALDLDETGPLRVEGRGTFPCTNRVWNAPATFEIQAEYAGGLRIRIAGAEEAGIRRGTKWIGDEGWVWVDRQGLETSPANLTTTRIQPGERPLPRSPGHRRQFIECVRTRCRPIAPAEAALRCATPGWLGLISMQLGRAIRWDPKREVVVGDDTAQRMLSRPLRPPWRL